MKDCVAIVPAYRAEATVAATLKSLAVLNRQPLDRIIVVVSPGDATARAVRAYAREDPLVELVESPCRLSAGRARNLGRRRAGDVRWLLFVDADCRLERGAAARLLADAREGGLDVVGAQVRADGGGLCAWLRHALEFKDADGSGTPAWSWMVPSATMLTRAELFDALGGFPDSWPGEDLTYCWLSHTGGGRIALSRSAVCRHQHPRGFATLLRHQYRLGFTSARARAGTTMPGAALVGRPWAAPGLLVMRALHGVLWCARSRARELPLLAALGPAYAAALAAWTWGFVSGGRGPGRSVAG